MKYKVGDKVRVRSRAWWDKQPKDVCGHIGRGYVFTKEMSSLCGRIVTIELVDDDFYWVEETSDIWEDWMFGCLNPLTPTQSLICLIGGMAGRYLDIFLIYLLNGQKINQKIIAGILLP